MPGKACRWTPRADLLTLSERRPGHCVWGAWGSTSSRDRAATVGDAERSSEQGGKADSTPRQPAPGHRGCDSVDCRWSLCFPADYIWRPGIQAPRAQHQEREIHRGHLLAYSAMPGGGSQPLPQLPGKNETHMTCPLAAELRFRFKLLAPRPVFFAR